MKDLDIIKQLYNGNHLEQKELERALYLLDTLKIRLKMRI